MNATVLPAVLILRTLAELLAGQTPLPGTCPTREYKNPFNFTQMTGKWYEQKRYYDFVQQSGQCTSASYYDLGGGSLIVKDAWYLQLANILVPVTLRGTLSFNGEATVGDMTLSYPSFGNSSAPYQIVDTDYTNYAIVWSCMTVSPNSGYFQNLWVYTRAKMPTSSLMASVDTILTQKGFNLSLTRPTSQACNFN